MKTGFFSSAFHMWSSWLFFLGRQEKSKACSPVWRRPRFLVWKHSILGFDAIQETSQGNCKSCDPKGGIEKVQKIVTRPSPMKKGWLCNIYIYMLFPNFWCMTLSADERLLHWQGTNQTSLMYDHASVNQTAAGLFFFFIFCLFWGTAFSKGWWVESVTH